MATFPQKRARAVEDAPVVRELRAELAREKARNAQLEERHALDQKALRDSWRFAKDVRPGAWLLKNGSE